LINFSKINGNKAANIGYGSIKAGQFEKVSASIYGMEIGSLITGSKGSDAIYGSGKGGVINGGAGNDTLSAFSNTTEVGGGIVLNGGAGNDKLSGNGVVTLVGGAGDDQFILDPYDDCTIADFTGKDYFLVRASSFRYNDYDLNQYVTPTFDKVNPVVAGTDPKPATALAQFFYDTDDGKLFYDADGVGLKFDLQLVMTLANKAALDASDFVFVA
jgi:RTX calcium-binding nonapeptide repeat (4 copies)